MSRRDKFWILALALLVLAQVIASLVVPRGDALTIASDWIQGTLLLLATAAFLPNTTATRTPSHRTRAFWILTGSGMFFWLSYQGMWNYFEVYKRAEVPNPFIGDVVLFLHLVPMMAALALLPHLQEDERDARIRMLDFALLLSWWVFLYVYAVIPWQTVHVNEPAYSSNFNATYLTEKLVLLIALVLITYNAHGGWRHLYAQLLGACALYASSSYVANYAIGRQTYYTGSFYDIPLILSMVWLALIGRFAVRFNLSEAKRSQPLLGVWITRLGMLALFSLPWFALYAQLEAGSPDSVRNFRSTLSLITMVVMGTLLFVRQTLLGNELAQLLTESRRSFEDLKTLQAQLIHSEKLASLGQLVGGAAHEINNPLTAMLGYSDLLSASQMPPQEQNLAARIAAQVRRTRTLVASLLTFVRQAPARMSAIDVNSVLQTAMRLLAPQLDVEAAAFQLDLGTGMPPVLADSNQLLHVCLHLAGQIGALPHPEDDSGVHMRTRHDGYAVSIEFSSSAASSSQYEPLLDSGKTSQNSTLSLGACARIVTEHGGRILAQRSDEEYVAFRLELPVAMKSSAQSELAVSNRAVASSSS
ncbi:MAG TPA: histidine kinase dimerization/phospho-acceptor domain-containing protein [Terriglobales bacterium]|nr:histidine kinase dimerization/phospho-acceptor domain-containing protein [Terriglobales bacterium]